MPSVDKRVDFSTSFVQLDLEVHNKWKQLDEIDSLNINKMSAKKTSNQLLAIKFFWSSFL